MAETKSKKTTTLHETCAVCGLAVGKSSTSLTSWIFGKSACACATKGNAKAILPAKVEIAVASPGQSFSSKYEVIGELGHGGMGTVYRVKELESGKVFALKVLRAEFALDKEAVKRFQSEIQATRALTHANMANVYDSGTDDDGCPYFVMDLVEGESLAEMLKREKSLPLQRALNIFLQIADALAYAHENKIIHRDLKPSNILIHQGADGIDLVKVVDFGIAKILPIQDAETLSLTRTAEIFGSPQYMSPEQCKGDRVDNRSDIYSLACVLFECLAGSAPFTSDNPVKVLLSQIYDDLPSMRFGLDGRMWPEHVQDVVRTGLAKRPEDRYADMKELSVDLQLLADNKQPKASRRLSIPAQRRRLKITTFKYSPLLLVAFSFLLIYLNQVDTTFFISVLKQATNADVTKAVINKADSYNKPFVVVTRAAMTGNGALILASFKEAGDMFMHSNRPRNAVNCYSRLIASQVMSGATAQAAANLPALEKMNAAAIDAPREKGPRLIGWFYMPSPPMEDDMRSLAKTFAAAHMFTEARVILLDQIGMLTRHPGFENAVDQDRLDFIKYCYEDHDSQQARMMTEQLLHNNNLSKDDQAPLSVASHALMHGDLLSAKRLYSLASSVPEAELGLACCAAVENSSAAVSAFSHYVHQKNMNLYSDEDRKRTCQVFVDRIKNSNRDYALALLKGLTDADKSADASALSYGKQYQRLLAEPPPAPSSQPPKQAPLTAPSPQAKPF